MNFLAGIKRLRGNESESLNEVPFYFPDPHAPWQRGTHENTTGNSLPRERSEWSTKRNAVTSVAIN